MNKEQKTSQTTEPAIVGNNVLADVPYQLCPKCNGQGQVSKPPYIAGDVHEWSVVVAYLLAMCAMAVKLYQCSLLVRMLCSCGIGSTTVE